VKTLQDIQVQLSKHKCRLFDKYPIKTMAIFGSYARKTQNEFSDIDILVDFKDQIGIRFIDLADEIEKILNTKVDLVSRRGIKEPYFDAIKSDLIYV
jgi:predicted nucleotidyltransferase